MANKPTTSAAAWSDDDLRDPHALSDKARRVRAMFAAIAPSYDLNNRLHSLGRDQAWRRAAVRLAEVQPNDVVLDVACGTGDLSLAFAAAGARRILGVDFTIDMLHVANAKERRGGTPPAYQAGDAMRLPIADASVDVVSIAFGIRNVADPAAAMAEFHRVLRPGGRLIVLEFGLPRNRLLKAGYMAYFKHILPRTAAWIAGDRDGAYRYLPSSVCTFIDREGMLRLMTDAGFKDCAARSLTFGVALAYRGEKS